MVESAGVFHKFLPPLLVEFTHQDKIWQNDFAHLFSLRFSDILLVRELHKSLVKKKPSFSRCLSAECVTCVLGIYLGEEEKDEDEEN